MNFTKMQGAGNDFIILDNRNGEYTEDALPELARTLCARKVSVGADGMMVLFPPNDDGDISMLFYNTDGTLGEMCGNGARCIARYAYDHGLSGKMQKIETTAGLVIARRLSENTYCVRLNDPSVLIEHQGLMIEGIIECFYTELGDPGIPHAVVELPWWEELPRHELAEIGAAIRHFHEFPKGCNVTFWKELSPNHLKAITYERGVEDFTMACGTGAGSTAACYMLMGRGRPDEAVLLDFPGGTLEVSLTAEDGTVREIYLTGPAVVVAEGTYIGR